MLVIRDCNVMILVFVRAVILVILIFTNKHNWNIYIKMRYVEINPIRFSFSALINHQFLLHNS